MIAGNNTACETPIASKVFTMTNNVLVKKNVSSEFLEISKIHKTIHSKVVHRSPFFAPTKR